MTSAKPLALTRQAVQEGLEVLRWCRMPSFSSDVAFEPEEVLPESGEHPEEIVVLLLVVRRKRVMTGSGGKIELASESLAQKGAFFTENTPAAITDSPSTKKPSKSPTQAPITDEPTTAPVTGEPTRSPTYFPSDAPTNAPVTSKPKPTLMPSGSPVQAFCRRSGWTGRLWCWLCGRFISN